MDVTKVGGLGDFALLDDVDTPQQDRQSASKLQGFTGTGAGRLAPSIPRNAQKRSGGDEGGVGGGSKGAQGAKSRQGKGGAVCVPWTDDERVALFESYLRTGGIRDGGYIVTLRSSNQLDCL